MMKHPFRSLAVVAALALTSLAPAAEPARASEPVPFNASFRGTFTLTFFTGPDATHELRFTGTGRGLHLGVATVDGYSLLRPVASNPGCSEIVHDEVTLTAANGDEVAVVNEAVDCMEVTPDGRVLIHGRGTYQITGGTGRFDSSTGAGSVSTEAAVTGAVPGGVTGTFDPLTFSGSISP